MPITISGTAPAVTRQGELQESLPYLEKSAERKVINGYLYLSKAYADLYRFDEAIENLDEHIYWLERKIVTLLKWKA